MKNEKMEYDYNIGDEINGLKIVEQMRIYKSKQKGYLVSSIKHPKAPPYKVTQSSLKQGKGCAYSNGSRIYEGNSLYSNISLRKNLIDVEEAKCTAPFSNNVKNFKCENCSFVKKMKVKNLSTYGFSCNMCSTKISYPELFFSAYVEVKNLNIISQQKMKNSKRLLFDFVDYENKIIIETHGEQHYDETCTWYERTHESDIAKRKWCNENGYTLIELDCRVSEFDFIKSKINDCELLPNIDNNDFDLILNIIKRNKRYDVKSIVKDYKNNISMSELEKKYKISSVTIRSILRKNNVDLNGKNYTRKRKVECITTGKIYDSLSEAAKDVGTYTTNISKAINPDNPRKYAGEIDSKKLYWKYVIE